jgi:hypothetical protein
MTTSLPPVAHAMQRAKERYGIDLSWADLRAMARRCKAGEGLTGRKGASNYHTLILGERVLWLVYKAPTPLEPDGVIVTIMPQAIALHMNAADAQHIKRRKDWRGRRKTWR